MNVIQLSVVEEYQHTQDVQFYLANMIFKFLTVAAFFLFTNSACGFGSDESGEFGFDHENYVPGSANDHQGL